MSKRAKVIHETRAQRARRSTLLKIGVWIFLAIFIFSVAGGVVLITAVGR